MNNNSERSLFSRASLLCAGLSFFIIPLVFCIVGIISGIVGLLTQEEQKHIAIIGIIICLVKVFGAL